MLNNSVINLIKELVFFFGILTFSKKSKVSC